MRDFFSRKGLLPDVQRAKWSTPEALAVEPSTLLPTSERASTVPPDTRRIDDPRPGGPDIFDRVTVKPQGPSEEHARALMEQAGATIIPPDRDSLDPNSWNLGPLDRPLHLNVPLHELQTLSVDHRAGFVLSLVDGQATLEEVLDMTGLPRPEALRIVADLVQRGVVEVGR